jgi:hypothetical protein
MNEEIKETTSKFEYIKWLWINLLERLCSTIASMFFHNDDKDESTGTTKNQKPAAAANIIEQSSFTINEKNEPMTMTTSCAKIDERRINNNNNNNNNNSHSKNEKEEKQQLDALLLNVTSAAAAETSLNTYKRKLLKISHSDKLMLLKDIEPPTLMLNRHSHRSGQGDIIMETSKELDSNLNLETDYVECAALSSPHDNLYFNDKSINFSLSSSLSSSSLSSSNGFNDNVVLFDRQFFEQQNRIIVNKSLTSRI